MESGLFNLRDIVNKKRQEANHSVDAKNAARSSALLKIKEQEGPTKKKKKKSSLKEGLDDQETLQTIEKSKSMLERKAALYEKLKSGTEVLEHDELNDRFLVNFQEKIIRDVKAEKTIDLDKKEPTKTEPAEDDGHDYRRDYPAKTQDEEWVEYTDCLGRSRMCQKKDLEDMREMDSNILGFDVKNINIPEDRTKEFHEKWLKIEEETKLKDDIHYQDVLFDEARVHGVGYMHFSRDEATRRKQQNLLKEIRKENLKLGQSKIASQKKRDELMSDRLAKVRQRKRLKMGLPALSLEERKLQEEPQPDIKEEEPQLEVEENMPQDSTEEPKPDPPVREWDIGKYEKSGFIMNQQQWVESRRKIRENEFAPPSAYNDPQSTSTKNNFSLNQRDTSGKKYSSTESNYKSDDSQNYASNSKRKYSSESNDDSTRRIGAEFAPPSTFEYYGPSTKRNARTLKPLSVEETIVKGLAHFRKAM